MAERRMFKKSVIESDAFLDMPSSTRLLYYDIGMMADDDGFINNIKRIIRMTGASEDDLNVLIARSFVIKFESGIIVIKHWKMHNYIKKDRYKPTIYQNERNMLELINNEYFFNPTGIIDLSNAFIESAETPNIQEKIIKDTESNQNVSVVDTESNQDGYVGKDRLGKDRLGKDRLGKVSLGKVNKNNKTKSAVVFSKIFEENNLSQMITESLQEFIEHRKQIRAPMSELAIKKMIKKLSAYDEITQIKMIDKSIENGWKGVFDIDEKNTNKPAVNNNNKTKSSNKFINFEQRDNDYDAIEKKAMQMLLAENKEKEDSG